MAKRSKAITTKSNKIEEAKSFVNGYDNGKSFTTTENLRLRTGASNTKSIIKILAQGSSVTWYGYYTRINGVMWYLVVDSDGETGFVKSQYLA